eukprot:TRINITY_DN6982_c0_g10_i2.p1 TRINITY_DN6982_c0_g10~~TRINITY_DN6982_c0_g10_i2.p1  ORF type:complete len:259 (+),score=52.35 TRINITY_DN6982_c0_g10_i2:72-848(+)
MCIRDSLIVSLKNNQLFESLLQHFSCLNYYLPKYILKFLLNDSNAIPLEYLKFVPPLFRLCSREEKWTKWFGKAMAKIMHLVLAKEQVDTVDGSLSSFTVDPEVFEHYFPIISYKRFSPCLKSDDSIDSKVLETWKYLLPAVDSLKSAFNILLRHFISTLAKSPGITLTQFEFCNFALTLVQSAACNESTLCTTIKELIEKEYELIDIASSLLNCYDSNAIILLHYILNCPDISQIQVKTAILHKLKRRFNCNPVLIR